MFQSWTYCGYSHEIDPIHIVTEKTSPFLNEQDYLDAAYTGRIPAEDTPEWAQDDPEKVRNYYAIHQEGVLDQMLGYMATQLGVIVHGNLNQEQLASNLQRYDVQALFHSDEGTVPCFEPLDHEVFSSGEAPALIWESLKDVTKVFDIHLHNLGYDEGNYLNPKASVRGIAKYKDYFTFMVLRYAAGMSAPEGSTQEARKRIQLYAQHFPKLCGIILPIHAAIGPDGIIDWDNTGNYLKNEPALQTALTFNSSTAELLPAVSVHPFDPLWEAKLIAAYAKGIRLVKWMPPQSIPPDSDLLDDYYKTMKLLGMTLIAHSGPEHAIPTNEDNAQWADWGNPLRFRKPLQLGVNVILAHCGHREKIPDLDQEDKEEVLGFHLFLRLAREAHQKNLSGEWTGKLFGDLAAVTNHFGPQFVKELLMHAHEEGVRLLYGSDYPYTNLIQPNNDAYDACAKYGLLAPEKVKPLKEIRAWNPLLANYIFTRNLELRTAEGQVYQFPKSTFTGEFSDAELKLIDLDAWHTYVEGRVEGISE